jgi:AraC-like DNA-binding protein
MMDLTCQERSSDNPLVERIWYNQTDAASPFLSIAQYHWEIVVSRIEGKTSVTLRGPETRASIAHCPPEAEFIGIQFKPGVLMPRFPAGDMTDRRDVNLPNASSQSFWLNGSAWEFPTFENAEGFVARLLREDLLHDEPMVRDVLLGRPVMMSLRTVQRRFVQTTGLSHSTIAGIQRARKATQLLKNGLSILDVVYQMGYADQPHLTRELKRFVGQTPAQIIAEGREKRLSFLFKTESF